MYWILFPIEDLRQAVETAKRILTKEKLDKQLTGQSSASPFMSIRDGTERKVSFNTRDELGDKIDKLTVVMSRLAAKNTHKKNPSNPSYIRVEVRIGLIIREVIRTDQIVGSGDNIQAVGPDKTIETVIFEETLQGMEEEIIGEDIRNDRCNDYNRGRNRSREKTFTGDYNCGRDRSSSNSRSRSGSRASTNRDKIRCYYCREYDHFVRDCPNSRKERDLEQLQKMLNIEAEEQTYRQDYPIENHRGPLNL